MLAFTSPWGIPLTRLPYPQGSRPSFAMERIDRCKTGTSVTSVTLANMGFSGALCEPANASGGPRLSLGVVWYLVPDETGDGDGGLTRYLEPSAKNRELYRSCAPALYDALGNIVFGSDRTVSEVQWQGILPPGTVFYDSPLNFEGVRGDRTSVAGARLAYRSRWLQDALWATRGCNIILITADNGLEVGSTARHHKRGPKYCFFDELTPFASRGQSLVIYQHISRVRTAANQIMTRLTQLSERAGGCGSPFAMLYHRAASRAFLIVPSRAQRHLLLDRAQEFVAGCWGQRQHFELVFPGRRAVG